jgi:hypothetical protein
VALSHEAHKFVQDNDASYMKLQSAPEFKALGDKEKEAALLKQMADAIRLFERSQLKRRIQQGIKDAEDLGLNTAYVTEALSEASYNPNNIDTLGSGLAELAEKL